ncbi:helix-turn-helix domain-containing protein [Paraburkholderia ginsengiterrae]|nr:helix-turn-helix domain-containing protein [Paraburkholderia phenoliruptrix]MBW9128143.1 helix-turn-helix domain-containing protein [Paraburkholderia ginsengiterrae]
MRDATIRSFLRGLEVLKALNTNNYLTALELSRVSSLPRPTVYRVLETLMKAGYVVRDEVTDVYSLTEKVTHLSCGYGSSAHVIELAKPLIKEFSEGICWPSYLHVEEGGAMVTRAIFRSPRALGYPRIGKRHSLVDSSPGRAYLASLPVDERQRRILASVDAAQPEGQRGDLNQLNGLIRDVTLLGCGFRDGGIVPRTCSISLPIHDGNDIAAYWTIVMMSSVLTVNKAITNYLADAQAVVGKIEQMVASHDSPSSAAELH